MGELRPTEENLVLMDPRQAGSGPETQSQLLFFARLFCTIAFVREDLEVLLVF